MPLNGTARISSNAPSSPMMVTLRAALGSDGIDMSVGELVEKGIDRAFPRAVEEFELAVGGGLSGVDELEQRFEVDGFVGAVAVVARATLQTVHGDLEGLARQVEQGAVAEGQGESMARYAIAQRMPFGHGE